VEEFRLRLVKSDYIVIILLAIKLVLTAIFFPELEMPDEEGHYRCIKSADRSSVYYIALNKISILLNKFGIRNCDLLEKDPNFSFAANKLYFFHVRPNCSAIIILKMFQIAFIGLFLFILYFWLKLLSKAPEKEKQFIFRLNLLFFSWPALSFSLTGLSTDFIIYLYEALFFILLVYYNRFFILIIINILMMKFFDLNPVIMLSTSFVYLFFYFVSKPEASVFPMKKKISLLISGIFLIFTYYLLMKFSIIVKIFPFLNEAVRHTYLFGYKPFKSLGAVFLSSYYLGGSMSLLATYFEYAVYAGLSILLLLRIFKDNGTLNNKIYIYIISCFVSINIVLLTIPTLKQGRFFYFILPLFIAHYFLNENKPKFVNYYVLGGILFFISTVFHLYSAFSLAY